MPGKLVSDTSFLLREDQAAAGAVGEDLARGIGEPALAIGDAASALYERAFGADLAGLEGDRAQVVDADVERGMAILLVERRHRGERHRRVEDRRGPAAMHRAQQIEGAKIGPADDHHAPRARLGDAEIERVADRDLRILAGDDALQVVESRSGALRRQPDTAVGAHTIPSSSCTSTLVPASTLPVASPRMMKQFASLMDLRIPDPCSPVGLTSSAPPAARVSTPRWNSVRPGAFFNRIVHIARKVGTGYTGFAPISTSSASRTN